MIEEQLPLFGEALSFVEWCDAENRRLDGEGFPTDAPMRRDALVVLVPLVQIPYPVRAYFTAAVRIAIYERTRTYLRAQTKRAVRMPSGAVEYLAPAQMDLPGIREYLRAQLRAQKADRRATFEFISEWAAATGIMTAEAVYAMEGEAVPV